jgi:hypothetical protein
VQRSAKCLDFASTATAIHVLVTSMYSADTAHPFPGTWSWWCVTAACWFVTLYGGEHLCRVRELEPIPIQGATAASKSRRGRKKKRTDGGVADAVDDTSPMEMMPLASPAAASTLPAPHP